MHDTSLLPGQIFTPPAYGCPASCLSRLWLSLLWLSLPYLPL